MGYCFHFRMPIDSSEPEYFLDVVARYQLKKKRTRGDRRGETGKRDGGR